MKLHEVVLLHILTRKKVPITGRASSFLVFLEFSKTKQNIEEGGEEQKQQTYQGTQGYSILHKLQVHHLSLTFINKYI